MDGGQKKRRKKKEKFACPVMTVGQLREWTKIRSDRHKGKAEEGGKVGFVSTNDGGFRAARQRDFP